ncbi:MAG: FHA domain-containing protein [Ilumatobacteraceae bacterium]|jgi:pSer/pThr/pTyr-binding forkhead associated (FHA) protein
MSSVYCNQCGHPNPPDAGFCAACGAALELRPDQTITIGRIDPLQEAPGGQDELKVPVGDIEAGQATLIVRNGPTPGMTLKVSSGLTRLGRHPDSEIQLDDITVSRRHAEIEGRDGGFLVRDVGSLNGTYVNAHRVDEAALHPGDEVQVGKFRMLFYMRSEP